ncbi:myeloid differentiation primary response protein MyD88-like [Anneissia japonica]|uniref:myeloid differentiation primary response protein MyD88-like n=1 Tax=Anneissia japonica TaxID=1529436 RepID=UPI001425A3BF|nr:myeloid differentiation primary response protein MyD88-like [Anneissia japonica]
MKLLETFKGIVNRNPCRSRSETISPNEPTNKNMIHSCSCPQLSIKASNAQSHSSNDMYTSSNSNCNENFDDFEQEFVFIPPLTNPNVESHCEPSSFESSVKSYDSSLSSSFEGNNHKTSASDEEFHSCFDHTQANQLSCQRQISATSSGSEAIDMDDIDHGNLQFSDIPAMALSIRTRTQMSLLLNIPLTLNNDWKMLAGELGFEYVEIENFGLQKDPTGAMISQWSTKGDSSLAGLMDALTLIDRLDVINCVKKFVGKGGQCIYCTYLYHTPLRSCHVTTFFIRCKRMIVVLSPRFTESPECDFQAKFALSLTPGNRLKRIVPIMYEMCSVPDILRFISVCDYTKEDLRPFFWERLAVALGLN